MNRDLELIMKINERAEKLGIGIGTRVTQRLDILNAHKHFNLRLDEFLNADDMNFCHDYIGIQKHIDRVPIPAKFTDCFVPRFAGRRD